MVSSCSLVAMDVAAPRKYWNPPPGEDGSPPSPILGRGRGSGPTGWYTAMRKSGADELCRQRLSGSQQNTCCGRYNHHCLLKVIHA